MIVKNRIKPPEIFQLESLLHRTPTVHPQFLYWTEKLRRITAGYNGELRVDSLWHEIDLPLPHYFFHDLFIQKERSSHQIDSVLVTSHFVLALEIKSISGLLNFDPQLRQFSRTNKDGSIDGMNNPDDQLRRHEKWLEQFLFQQRIKLPVIGAIVFTYPSSVVQSRAGNRIMIQASGLPHLMEKLLEKHSREILSKKKTESLAYKLLELSTIKPLAPLGLSTSFMKGIFCPHCLVLHLNYRRGKWRCDACTYCDPIAHLDALLQYRTLVKPTISNREFREFTGIHSSTTASKLLKSANMPFAGSYKDRIYSIPELFESTESI
ncbi:NERD domain-containing protein [Planococcus sp. CPCC 101016]|uniref:nuclease-related domain-containing protein n=1 Tax=Planococcus sp. CPCC 101016 TaxID=2599617 RepID=UPI0011B62DD1|nr:nuclease-related domain-containing protein [Planococcus sp. CPCC 101016]TWT06896.1 NERD domain-containing protein [Planococcus sp. CPCC 101016]